MEKIKEIYWIGQSLKDLKKMPKAISETFAYGIRVAQQGGRVLNSKILKGFGNAKLIELKESDRSGTYRLIYTVEMKEIIFILHVFQKKSKQGIATPKKEMDLIESRLKLAKEIYKDLL